MAIENLVLHECVENIGTRSRCTRVLFLLERPEAWVNIASVWRCMSETTAFRPVVWVLPHYGVAHEVRHKKLLLTRQVLQQDGVGWVECTMDQRLTKDEFDAVVFTHPYDLHRPAGLYFHRVASLVRITIYIPYALPMGAGRKNLRLHHAQPVQTGATVVVARSKFEKQQYAEYCPSGDRHVHVLGHPRFDWLPRALAEPVPAGWQDVIAGRICVLWNSHFSFGLGHRASQNFSTFDEFGPEIFDLVMQHRESLCLVWRPHPLLLQHVVSERLLTEGEVESLRMELRSSGILLDETPTHASAFKVSDAMMSDTSSFLLEYLVTGKSILALINANGEPLNNEAEILIAQYRQARSASCVAEFLDDIRQGKASADYQDVLDNHLPYLDGNSGARVVALIAQLCGVKLPKSGRLEDHDGAVSKAPAVSHYQRSRSNSLNVRAVVGPETPVLHKLSQGLTRLRDKKRAETPRAKGFRRSVSAVHTTATEWGKTHPFILDFASTIRRLMRRGK